ncbi:hypothetical protein WJN01_12830 [Flavobacteriaceae bacterium SZ-1-7]|uniref:hypothetical protein n=1 Tax=Tamlana sedimenti TaxID=3134126 RepID=UPI003122959E
MKPSLKTPHSSQKPRRESAIKVKYGKNYYEFLDHSIAYIYKKEGLHFIANKENFKFPFLIKDLNEILIDLSSDAFFALNESTIFSKDSVRLKENSNECYAIAFNKVYKDTFIIPENLQKKFKAWMSR